MTRWYDKYEELRRGLEVLKSMDRKERVPIVKDVLSMIKENDQGIIEATVMDYPLDSHRRRWYDRDPYLWLMVNSLKCSDPDLVKKVGMCLEERLTVLKLRQAGLCR